MSREIITPSPLDPFLRTMLRHLDTVDGGFLNSSATRLVAEREGWPQPFVDVLLTCARTRGMIEPAWTRLPSSRRWRVSPLGESWMATPAEAPSSTVNAAPV